LEVRAFTDARIPAIRALGFECVGYLTLACITSGTAAYRALFSNGKTLEWADVSVVMSTTKMCGLIKFINNSSGNPQVDTKNNSTMPLLSPHPGGSPYGFLFPQINDAFTLYRIHRMPAQPRVDFAKGSSSQRSRQSMASNYACVNRRLLGHFR
jgi:hypothetical protein